MLGRNIRIYLSDGTISGIKHSEIVNWTGQALSVPRNKLSELIKWSEAQKPGVYFLLGYDENNKVACYVGEAENVYQRLLQHLREKEFWNEAILFTNKDENLTKSHIKYLEIRLVEEIKKANRYNLLNSNTPQATSLPRGDIDSMEEFILNIRTLLGALGHKTLESLIPQEIKAETISSDVNINENIKILFLKISNIDAKGQISDEGFIVHKGSHATKNITNSLNNNYKALRETLVDDGILKDNKDTYIFEEDYLFSSSSQAAACIVGYSVNGRISWKNNQGTTLKDIEESFLISN